VLLYIVIPWVDELPKCSAKVDRENKFVLHPFTFIAFARDQWYLLIFFDQSFCAEARHPWWLLLRSNLS